MTITQAFRALIAEFAEQGIPAPMHQFMPVYALWSDLSRIAGEKEPIEVAAIMDAPAATPIGPGVDRWVADGGDDD